MKKVFAVVVICVLAWVGYLIFRPVSYRNLPPTATGPWIAYGDSLTSGYGASEGTDYPNQLSKILGVPIQNFGVAGDTTEAGLARIDKALELQPRVVLLCLGGNDGLMRLPAEAMISNLRQMIRAFQAKGSFVVLIGVRSASLLDKNDGLFKRLAKEEQVFYVHNILAGVIGSPSLMSDQIHPNEAGYKAIADRLAESLSPLLSQLR